MSRQTLPEELGGLGSMTMSVIQTPARHLVCLSAHPHKWRSMFTIVVNHDHDVLKTRSVHSHPALTVADTASSVVRSSAFIKLAQAN